MEVSEGLGGTVGMRPNLSRRGYKNPGTFSRLRSSSDQDFHIAIKPRKESHQPFDRKAIQPVIREGGNLWLVYFQPPRRIRLRISLSTNDVIYFYGQPHLGLLVLDRKSTRLNSSH